MNQNEDIRRHNDSVAQRFSKIEAGIDAARGIDTVFKTLFYGVETEFDLPFVWLTLIDEAHTQPLISAVTATEHLKNRLCILTPEAFSRLIPNAGSPVLANRDLAPYYRLLPPRCKYFIKSLAVVPFMIDTRVAGSWNNGDSAAERYSPEMETELLAGLGRALSRKLSQLVSSASAKP